MTTSTRSLRRHAAWAAPVLTAAVVGGVALLPSAASASAHPVLPSRTAAQLLADVQTVDVSALSGTIVETARLGIPTLPGADNAASLSFQTLVTGTHTARVWLDGPQRQRLALLGQLSESDVVHAGTDLWTYASSSQQVQHTVLPAEAAGTSEKAAGGSDLQAYTPQGAAAQALAAVDPTTVVTVERTARVAGRPAYTLVLAPRDSRSTVRRVALALDAATKLPLRVQVYGAAAQPAFETAFTDVSFRAPAASVFTFRAPKGSTVMTKTLSRTTRPAGKGERGQRNPAPTSTPTTVGRGWASVLVLPAGSGASALGGPSGGTGSSAALLGQLTTTLPNGDRLLRSALLNVLLAKDGRVLVGAVSPDVLRQAAAGQLQ